ncbi:MAG: hypothetical protein KAT76_06355 [Bacteroidales bacterium]|nr:hypothetical protein [Bacteroidales bacterium]
MKKKIMIGLIAVFSISIMAFSLTQMEENNPPDPIWGYDITWDDSECNCENPEADLDWIVTHWNGTSWVEVDYGVNYNVNPALGIFTVKSDEPLVDCLDCYKICGSIVYTDESGICCKGKACLIVDSDELLYDDEVVHIVMQ